MERRLVNLSRTVAYALRHHPEDFGLRLDDEGWVFIQDLIDALHNRSSWKDASIDDLNMMIEQSDKKRFEMQDGMIRAYYGHSLAQKLTREPISPPEYLFHGTTPEAAEKIKVQGLKPMKRQYVHLSADESTARAVALRRTRHPVILSIHALEAFQQGTKFYGSNDTTWLADTIAPHFIHA